jgi:hypothetical protein
VSSYGCYVGTIGGMKLKMQRWNSIIIKMFMKIHQLVQRFLVEKMQTGKHGWTNKETMIL